MASPLSLDWSPPSTSLLFDEPIARSRTNDPTVPRSLPSSVDRDTSAGRVGSGNSNFTGPLGVASDLAPFPLDGEPSASVASYHTRPQHHQYSSQHPPSGFPMFGSQFQQQPFGQSTPGYFAQMPPPQNQFAWAQYQQMLQAQAQQFYQQGAAGDGAASPEGRRRTSSVPQRPAPITYNDTFRQQQQQQQQHAQTHAQLSPQGFPGVAFAGGQPPMQMRGYVAGPAATPNGGVSPGHHGPTHSASSSVSSAGGFHPYRRTTQQRQNPDVGSPQNSIQFGQLPPTSTGQMAGPVGAPRARTSSTNSVNSARDSAVPPSPMSAPERRKGLPTSSSHVAVPAGAQTRAQPAPSNSTQAGLAHLRGVPPPRSNSQTSLASDRSGRPGGSSEIGSKATASGQHGRNESTSSTISNGGARSVSASAASAAASKRPSPLSRQSAQRDDDEDDDGRAVYGGSDDENRAGGGRSTPMPGAKPKKTGLSGKLRKALSFSNMAEMQQASETQRGVPARAPPLGSLGGGHPNSSGDTNGSTGSTRSTSPPRTPENGVNVSSAASISSRRSGRPPLSSANEGKRSIFNRKFNSSTDNISISSTVSSASVMLRKVGNLGKLARRHSLMGLTNMFNKEKERDGREGFQHDDFGTPQQSADDSTIDTGAASKGKKSKSKKASPATASITHATVELESSRGADTGMTPAASYVRQHQLQMQQQAELEAKAARERAEAEAKASRAAEASASNTRQKMIEEEKQKMKSKRGWRKKFGSSGGGSISSDGPTGLETTYADPDAAEETDAAPYGGYTTPEVATGPAIPSLPPQIGMAYEDGGFDASFDRDELLPPHMPAAGGGGSGEDSGDEFETESLRRWGEGIERSRASAANFKNPKSILKKTASFDHLPNLEKPFAGRVRANSYDAPQSASAGLALTSSTPSMSQISQTAESVERLDGVARSDSPQPSRPDSRSGDDTPGASARNTPRSGSPHGGLPAGGLGHHPNSSMPTLSLMMDADPQLLSARSMTGPPQARKKLVFADEHIYHSTWPAHVYDRRGELATCNRLTPVLAQRIKEELNTYKMEEMAVAASSRIYTHFFV